jgi:hypothetical protein
LNSFCLKWLNLYQHLNERKLKNLIFELLLLLSSTIYHQVIGDFLLLKEVWRLSFNRNQYRSSWSIKLSLILFFLKWFDISCGLINSNNFYEVFIYTTITQKHPCPKFNIRNLSNEAIFTTRKYVNYNWKS